MAEYIDREALIKWLTKATDFQANCEDCCDIDCVNCVVEECIKIFPKSDVAEVKHAKWELRNMIGIDWYNVVPRWFCTNCGFNFEDKSHKPKTPSFNYCPNCGAKMNVPDIKDGNIEGGGELK